jgi:hypothetical protein
VELAESAGIPDAAPGFLAWALGFTPDFPTGGGRFPHPVEGGLGCIDVVGVAAGLEPAG